MPKQERRGEFVTSIPVYSPDDVSTLDSERMWEILHYVHERPTGVRPKEVARKFDIGVNQAYDKLRRLEKADYLVRQKQRRRPGSPGPWKDDEAGRKTLLYVATPWGETALDEEWSRILLRKYGRFAMEELRPALLKFYKRVIEDMKKEKDLKSWYPAPHENVCPECELDHQALELFRSLGIFAMDVTEQRSYEMNQVLLDNGYITRKEFQESNKKEEGEEDWVLMDKPRP